MSICTYSRFWRSSQHCRSIHFIMVCILLVAWPAYGTDYFVDPNGNDSDDGNSIDHPFATIPKAVDAAAAGDTIYLRGGTHSYSATISITKSGTSGNPITLQNYQDEEVIIDFSGESTGSRGINLSSASYWHFKGFTVQYAGDNGIIIQNGTYNTLERIVARYNEDSGIQLHTGCAYNLILNCDSYYNCDVSTNGENADGFAAKFTLGAGNVFRGCRSWDNSDDGYDLWTAANTVTFEDCWAFHNGINHWGISSFQGDGNGFKLGLDTVPHVTIRCVAYNNEHNGFDRNQNSEGSEIYNCTSVNNLGYNYRFDLSLSGFVLRNNISYLGTNDIAAAVDDEYNTWNTGFSVSAADFVSLDSNGIDGSRQADGNLPELSFLRLTSSSALIDAGINVGEPYEGSAPDLGAYEYVGGDYAPAAPTGLSATAGEGTVSLDWNDNSESDLDGYNIYRSTTSGSGYVKQNGLLLGTSDYVDNSVTNGTTYYYVVTAVDVNSNESNYSSQDSATPGDYTPPAAPTGLTAMADDQMVRLDWNSNSESDLAGYNVYRSTTSGSGYAKLNGTLLSSPGYDDDGLTNTITYYYVVTAVDTSSNESAYSSEVSATPRVYGDFVIDGAVDINDLAYLVGLWLESDCELTAEADLGGDCMVNFYEFSAFSLNWGMEAVDVTAPAAPTNLSATAGDATVSLDWDDNSESDLAGYNVYRSTTSGSGYSMLNGSLLTDSNYVDSSVTNGTTYYYVVTAVDTADNESDDSTEDSATPSSPSTSITIQENETGFCDVDGSIDNNNQGYTGTGFANTDNASGNGVDYSINVLTAGTYTFTWRYANGTTTDRPGNLIINSTTEVSGISFPGTGAWTTWDTTTEVEVTLTAGTKDVRIEATTINGLANIDYMQVTGPNFEAATCP